MPANEKKVFFRKNLIGGFNKADVIEYLSAQSREQISEKENQKRELNEKIHRNKELSDRLANYENEFIRLNKQLSDKDNAYSALEAECDALKRQISQSSSEHSKLEQNISLANELRGTVEQKLEKIYTELRAVAGATLGDGVDIAQKDEEIARLREQLEALGNEKKVLNEKVKQLSEYKNKIQDFFGMFSGISGASSGGTEK